MRGDELAGKAWPESARSREIVSLHESVGPDMVRNASIKQWPDEDPYRFGLYANMTTSRNVPHFKTLKSFYCMFSIDRGDCKY